MNFVVKEINKSSCNLQNFFVQFNVNGIDNGDYRVSCGKFYTKSEIQVPEIYCILFYKKIVNVEGLLYKNAFEAKYYFCFSLSKHQALGLEFFFQNET